MDTANYVYDIGKYSQATRYLDSVTHRYKNLGLSQLFDYYSFNYNYYFNIKEDDSKAMRYADSMLYLFKRPEDKMKYATYYGRANFSKGDVLFRKNKYNEAYEYYYQGKLIAEKNSNDCTLSDYSYRMGMIMYKQEHFRLAAENFINSSNEIKPCDLRFPFFYRRQEMLNNTGLSYSKIGEADSAMVYFNKALDYIDREAPRFKKKATLLDAARGVIYGNEANIFIQKKNLPLATALLKKSAEINLRKGNDNNDAALSELKLAHIYYQAGETDSLYNLLGIIHKQLDVINNHDAEADYNVLMANYFTTIGKPGRALNYFIKYDYLKDSIQNKSKALKEADIAQQITQFDKDAQLDNLKKNNQLQYIYLHIALAFGLMLILIFFLIYLHWQKSKKNLILLGHLNDTINDQNITLENALNELKLSSQEKDRILRTVAHDLRNPIGGIASITNVMTADNYNDDQLEFINLIKETSNNSLELINEILEVTNDGSSCSNLELVEINSLLNNSVGLLRFKAAEKNQTIIFEGLRSPEDLLINREKIWRVIGNLISNAIKFSSFGAKIIVRARLYDDGIEVSIQDSGIGIPKNIENKIFNTFTEAKRSGTAGEKSFGLGLSISKQIVECHHGKIWFENNPDAGTTFYFRLPQLHVNNIISLESWHKSAQMI